MTLTHIIINKNYLDNAATWNLFAGKKPLSVLHDTRIANETLIRLYHKRHNFDINDPWGTVALATLGNMTIANLATNLTSTLNSWLLLLYTHSLRTRPKEASVKLSCQRARHHSARKGHDSRSFAISTDAY